ncbi:hypothetical protein [Synechococcus sp. KORDI-49]|uniref:hypothetical protein n=1 Tax=Synechococcus sp. KORDI-49 TaxID=585423 RepID=UPI0012EB5E10|nr:hypothetical protein [Synechococcus sp. KORDI-49]
MTYSRRYVSDLDVACGRVLTQTLDKDAVDMDQRLTEEEWTDFCNKYQGAFALAAQETAEMMLEWYSSSEDEDPVI